MLTPLFEGKGAREDFAEINQHMEGLVVDLTALKLFLSHVSSNEALKERILFGKEIYAQGVMAVAETEEVASTILVAQWQSWRNLPLNATASNRRTRVLSMRWLLK